MTMTPVSELVVDGILALLLIAVIVVSVIVYRRLGAIRDGQAELRDLIDNLNTAVVNAERSIHHMREAAVEVEGRLKAERQKAGAMAEELSLITEAGNNLANRIERGLTSGRPAPGKEAAEEKPSLKEQQELLAALREAR